ncbi:unnamed protein product, partial [Discosporangium mesarthrocarpum]
SGAATDPLAAVKLGHMRNVVSALRASATQSDIGALARHRLASMLRGTPVSPPKPEGCGEGMGFFERPLLHSRALEVLAMAFIVLPQEEMGVAVQSVGALCLSRLLQVLVSYYSRKGRTLQAVAADVSLLFGGEGDGGEEEEEMLSRRRLRSEAVGPINAFHSLGDHVDHDHSPQGSSGIFGAPGALPPPGSRAGPRGASQHHQR